MNECCRCGAPGEDTRLFDAICDKGIVKVCQNCSLEDNFLMVRKPTSNQLKDAEKKESYLDDAPVKSPVRVVNKEDASLREIVDQNLQIKSEGEVKPRPDLVHNFHWAIMRARRAKHISQEQFARELGESETLIKMVEKGILPEDDNKIIRKIETCLNIKLKKPGFEEKKTDSVELGFDSVNVRNLTISDLNEMKKEKSEEIFSNPVEVWEGDIEADSEGKEENVRELKREVLEGNSPEKEGKQDLSKKEMDDLIFGKGD
jgi:ribosome-binding protein aMBF1 (putative translation factor)